MVGPGTVGTPEAFYPSGFGLSLRGVFDVEFLEEASAVHASRT